MDSGPCPDHQIVTYLVCLLIMLPASMLRDFKTLSYYSGLFAACSIASILIVITYDCIQISENKRTFNVPEVKMFDWTLMPMFLG